MFPFILFIIIISFAVYFIAGRGKNKVVNSFEPDTNFLEKNVLFYSKLDTGQKQQFNTAIKCFLNDVKITGVDTTVEDTDKLLVAAAAIIPIFYFKKWKYYNLSEVLLYSDAINMDFQTTGSEDRNILGMVGTGSFEGKMLLSKHALQQGFFNKTDKSNTAIHEFVHLIDKSDGDTDGIPEILIDKQFILPWIDLIKQQVSAIAKNKSDINPYATMNNAEFLAVTAEYFFERPDLLETKHPQLYNILKEIFDKP